MVFFYQEVSCLQPHSLPKFLLGPLMPPAKEGVRLWIPLPWGGFLGEFPEAPLIKSPIHWCGHITYLLIQVTMMRCSRQSFVCTEKARTNTEQTVNAFHLELNKHIFLSRIRKVSRYTHLVKSLVERAKCSFADKQCTTCLLWDTYATVFNQVSAGASNPFGLQAALAFQNALLPQAWGRGYCNKRLRDGSGEEPADSSMEHTGGTRRPENIVWGCPWCSY